MAFKDILLTLTSYPEPTPVSVVEDAVSIATALGAHLAAVSCEVHVQVPGHFLAGSIANIPGIIAGEGALLFASSHRFAESAADIRYRALWLGKLDHNDLRSRGADGEEQAQALAGDARRDARRHRVAL